MALLLSGCGGSDSTATTTPVENRYAVIISGRGDPVSNGERFWREVSLFYSALKKNGIPDANIYVIVGDGTDPAYDALVQYVYDGRYEFWYIDSNPDLDGDGLPDVFYCATKANVTAVFNQLATRVGANDILYMFVTSHGGATQDNPNPPILTPNVSLGLRDGESITADEMAALLDKVKAKATVGIFQPCYGGGFVEKLAAPGRVLMSASRWWESSYGWLDVPYDPFAYYAITALSDPAKGNTNGDGPSTIEGAYLYALSRDEENEHPSYSSNPWDLGRKLTLQGSMPTLAPPVYAGFSETESGESYPPLGQAQGWHADDAVWSYPLPFAFPFGSNRYDAVIVSSNGIIYFSPPDDNLVGGRGALPATVSAAPFWSNLTTADSGSDIFIDSTAHQVTIAWKAKSVKDSRQVNVAARLQDDGVITFYYGDGNDLIGIGKDRKSQDKTIGLAPGDGTVLYSLRNGAQTLDNARSTTFTPAGQWGGSR